jgi:hypothetical protein
LLNQADFRHHPLNMVDKTSLSLGFGDATGNDRLCCFCEVAHLPHQQSFHLVFLGCFHRHNTSLSIVVLYGNAIHEEEAAAIAQGLWYAETPQRDTSAVCLTASRVWPTVPRHRLVWEGAARLGAVGGVCYL